MHGPGRSEMNGLPSFSWGLLHARLRFTCPQRPPLCRRHSQARRLFRTPRGEGWSAACPSSAHVEGSAVSPHLGPAQWDLRGLGYRSSSGFWIRLKGHAAGDGVLIDWINDVLVEERIIVKQLEEDLYDGQVLQKLLEKLAGCKLNVAEVTQSEIGQKQKLQTVLEAVQGLLRPHGWALQWTVDSIHGKNLVAILHLLVSLAMHFRAPIRLPEHVSVQVVVVRKREGLLHSSHVTEELTTTTEMMMGRFERDAFDTLFDHAPDKLSVVKKSLITFVNKHLNKLNLEVTELETQFADGVYLVLLMGLLEDYFVPLHNFYLTPDSFDQKVHNVAFAFELMLDGGLKTPKARPEDVVNLDLKSTLRVLYNLFTKYKHLE
ncbi:beta-parvin isoform X1 [Phoca vitulina]|uniref:beta-parvin isoform X1 n=1 Tax=Phoca vitulina TaxID=9720 RepID=UPI001395FDEF|nr:beta-parvin isoform X1 [Phoca vitulina]